MISILINFSLLLLIKLKKSKNTAIFILLGFWLLKLKKLEIILFLINT